MTTSPVVLFNYQDHYVRTITNEQGEPWFVAADVCDILENKNPTHAVKSLPDDERASKNGNRKYSCEEKNEVLAHRLC
jgi:anti-repressor protein